MACRSGKLRVVRFCVFDLTCGTAVQTLVSLYLLSVLWLLQIPQHCRNRCGRCYSSALHLCRTINITAASVHQGAVLTRDTTHYGCITKFSPGWWEWDERVLSSYMQINRTEHLLHHCCIIKSLPTVPHQILALLWYPLGVKICLSLETGYQEKHLEQKSYWDTDRPDQEKTEKNRERWLFFSLYMSSRRREHREGLSDI